MRGVVYKWLDRLWGTLLPGRCVLCEAATERHRDLCNACLLDLPRLDRVCPSCGAPMPIVTHQPCGQCIKRPPAYDQVWAAFAYEFPIDDLIQKFKFADRLVYGRLLARLMLESGPSLPPLPEVLIPVPMHPARLRERGFNQATELARQLGRRLDLPVAASLLKRTRNTPAQAGLNAASRRSNLDRAFQVQGDLACSHLALVDDVMTTGSTAESCARILRAAGAERVDVWVCARA